MQIKEYIDKNFEFQNRISSISKQYSYIKDHPLESSLLMMFNLMEMQNNFIKEIGNFCSSLIVTLTKVNYKTNTNNDVISNGSENNKDNYVNSALSFRKRGSKTFTSSFTDDIVMNDLSGQINIIKNHINNKLIDDKLNKSNINKTRNETNLGKRSQSMDTLHYRNYSNNGQENGINIETKKYITIHPYFKIKPTYQTKELLRKSYIVLDQYLTSTNYKDKK